MLHDIEILGGVIGLVFAWLLIMHTRDHIKRHGMHRITGRVLTGRPSNGDRYTNASFLRKSDGITRGHPTGRVSKRHHRPGVINLARLLGWIVALILFVYGLEKDYRVTLIAGIVAIAGALAYRGYVTIQRLRAFWIKRSYIAPLAEALGPILELTGPEAEDLITLAPDWQTKKLGNLGRIDLPPRVPLVPGQQAAIEHVINTRLPVGADLVPHLSGRSPHLIIKAAPALPSMVRFEDYLDQIEELSHGQYIAGIDRRTEIYTAKFIGPEPHHGMAWGTGAGKSTQMKSIIAQIKHNEPDATMTILDPKEISLESMKGVPGLAFYDDASEFDLRIPGLTLDTWQDFMPGMWQGIKSTYDLMNDRFREMKRNPTAEFPTHLAIFEEMNSFALMSKAWWQRNKPKGIQGVQPPLWADWIAPLFWRARQANIFIVLSAQSIQERFLGGLSLRASLGLVSLAKYKPSQYQNYIGTVPIPKMQKGQGRALYNDGESDTWVQCLYGQDGFLRDYAMANIRNAAPVPRPRQIPA